VTNKTKQTKFVTDEDKKLVVLVTLLLDPEYHDASWGPCFFKFSINRTNPEFGANFTETVQLQLAVRLLHHFIRKHGFRLMGDPDKVGSVYTAALSLMAQYNRDLPMRLDVTLIRSDLDINFANNSLFSDPHVQINESLLKVGETLEGQSKFADAAVIYNWSADTYCLNDDLNRGKMLGNAGLAFKRDYQYEAAEEAHFSLIEERLVLELYGTLTCL